MKLGHPPLCPSAPLTPKAKLLGVVTGGGQIAFLGKPTAVDSDFIEVAKMGREPDRRFRFASPCSKGGCANWNGSGCSLPERVLADLTSPLHGPLPECGIRDRCVWYAQTASAACRSCRFVVTRADQ